MKNRVFVILVLLTILALALATGFSLLWRLFILALLMLLISYWWVFLGIRNIEAQVKQLPQRCQVGETIDEEVTLLNQSNLPKLFLQARENTDLPEHRNLTAVNLSPHGAYTWRNKVRFHRRGRYRLGSYTITASDPFGFFQRPIQLGSPQSILVCPETIELPHFDPMAYHAYGYGTKGKLAGQMSTNVASVREYTNGDSLKHLHWHTTAHTGKLMVKIFDPDHSRNTAKNVWIVVDMQQSVHTGDGDKSTEEYTVTIATTLIKKYMDNGASVGLIASAEQNYFFTPEWGSQPFWNMLTALALMQADGDVPVEQIIASEPRRFGNDSIVIVITPSESERLSTALRQITSREGLVVTILIDGGNMARTLISIGAQVYVVRRGDNVASALNSRRNRPILSAKEPPPVASSLEK